MPFQYVWQYQNTETTVLAQDIVDIINANNLLPFDCSQCSPGGGGAVNTADYIPVSNGLTFEDSWLRTKDIGNNPYLATIFPVVGEVGFLLQPGINRYTFGECNPFATGFKGRVVVDNQNQYVALNGQGSNSFAIGVNQTGIVLNGETYLAAGVGSGMYLQVSVNNIMYKLALLTP